eukprot:gene21379-28323_t
MIITPLDQTALPPGASNSQQCVKCRRHRGMRLVVQQHYDYDTNMTAMAETPKNPELPNLSHGRQLYGYDSNNNDIYGYDASDPERPVPSPRQDIYGYDTNKTAMARTPQTRRGLPREACVEPRQDSYGYDRDHNDSYAEPRHDSYGYYASDPGRPVLSHGMTAMAMTATTMTAVLSHGTTAMAITPQNQGGLC